MIDWIEIGEIIIRLAGVVGVYYGFKSGWKSWKKRDRGIKDE